MQSADSHQPNFYSDFEEANAYHISQTDKEISYLYSIDDQRMFRKIKNFQFLHFSNPDFSSGFKEIISPTETKREYYLADAMGHVVALRSEVAEVGLPATSSWEYYLHGSEREARLVSTDANPKFGNNEVSFFLYDHLGNTRMSYTPNVEDIPASDPILFEDLFPINSTDGWLSSSAGTSVSNPNGGQLEVVNTTGIPSCVKPSVMLNEDYTYTIDYNVSFSSGTLNLLVGNSLSYALTNGSNSISIPIAPNGQTDFTIEYASGSAPTSFELKFFTLTEHIPASIDISYTVNHVVDYYPYGKVVREFVEGEKERYLTTQHERDEETGLDYRGARYYDCDVARFLSLDPLATKYPSLSPYNYVAANPIVYIDTDGKEIVVPNKEDRPKILEMIHQRSSGTFEFTKEGKLRCVAINTNCEKSDYYLEKLVTATQDQSLTIEISINQTAELPDATVVDVDDYSGGGITIGGLKTDQNVVISGNENTTLKDTNGDPLRDKPSDILMHELLGHAIPNAYGTDTGNAVDNENKGRAQLPKGYDQLRELDPLHTER